MFRWLNKERIKKADIEYLRRPKKNEILVFKVDRKYSPKEVNLFIHSIREAFNDPKTNVIVTNYKFEATIRKKGN